MCNVPQSNPQETLTALEVAADEARCAASDCERYDALRAEEWRILAEGLEQTAAALDRRFKHLILQ